jgi:hypothetical protein
VKKGGGARAKEEATGGRTKEKDKVKEKENARDSRDGKEKEKEEKKKYPGPCEVVLVRYVPLAPARLC